jgi:hypothetical protein
MWDNFLPGEFWPCKVDVDRVVIANTVFVTVFVVVVVVAVVVVAIMYNDYVHMN